jgi:hypothetical protein
MLIAKKPYNHSVYAAGDVVESSCGMMESSKIMAATHEPTWRMVPR